jgi:hypothetical protein
MFVVAGTLLIAQSPLGRFRRTGEMTQKRQGHTATLLNDGRVLIVGGVCNQTVSPCVDTAEIYDPETGTFTKAGSLTGNRRNHSATLLPDGRVLIVGGFPAVNPPNPEIYDPTADRFTPINLPGVAGPAITLADGRVLFAGPRSLVVYDPVNGQWTKLDLRFDLRFDYNVTRLARLASGEVLVAGFDVFYRVDPRSGSVVPIADLSLHRESQTSTVLLDGRVLFACGAHEFEGYAATDGLAVYDPGKDSLSSYGKLPEPRTHHSATLLPNGEVFILGGYYDTPPWFEESALLNSGLILDLSRSGIRMVGSTDFPRYGHSATLLRDGRVLIAGGLISGSLFKFAEIYEPANPIPAASLYARADGSGAILHAGTSRLVTWDDPAEPGEIIELYGTGLIDGSVIPPLVSIGGRAAEVVYFGTAPGYDSLNQINVRVPSGAPPGRAVSVRMNYMDRPSNEVTLAIR